MRFECETRKYSHALHSEEMDAGFVNLHEARIFQTKFASVFPFNSCFIQIFSALFLAFFSFFQLLLCFCNSFSYFTLISVLFVIGCSSLLLVFMASFQSISLDRFEICLTHYESISKIPLLCLSRAMALEHFFIVSITISNGSEALFALSVTCL